MPCWSKTWPVIRPELEMSSCANLALLKLLITKIHSKYINYVIQISLSGNAKSQLSLQCSLDMTENLVLNSLNPNLVAAKVSESVKHLINQESVKTKEVITVNTSLDLDTFSKLLPFLRCYFVNEENKLNVEDQASKTTRLIKTTNPIYSTNADASNTTRLNETTDPTYSTNADGSMEIKILMVISICSTFLIAVALVCTGILIYSWKRVFNVGSGEIIFCI
ncbi:uncharacterized protein LOC129921596 isoform X5 [Biomphalaria glabrata]|uniref:Uncharacterized protein LOC129921596 isoform X5 n=1 Tax=Biomphalaria glabrata TaxID=6526 RepID=A0A9W3AMT9_BIOGL|nr:uncharacterized protein LOC129921596 isoform X5 [Biomphalaria glabrata]